MDNSHESNDINPLKEKHVHRRRFIGPMPERIISNNEAAVEENKKRLKRYRRSTSNSSTDSDSDDELPSVIRNHALNLFLREGGDLNQWGEQERTIKQEMKRRWRESEWGRILRRRKEKGDDRKKASDKRWIGNSFDIGNFLGMNVMEEENPEHIQERISVRSQTGMSSTRENTTPPSTIGLAISSPSDRMNSASTTGTTDYFDASSGSALLSPRTASPKPIKAPLPQRPILAKNHSSGIRSDTHVLFNTNRPDALSVEHIPKAKSVHYLLDHDEDHPLDLHRSTPSPAPVGEVLERSGPQVEGTSAGATEENGMPDWIPEFDDENGDIVLSDRMMVKIYYSSTGVSPGFDEVRNLTTGGLQFEGWGEYMVVWKKHGQLELYENYPVPGLEWLRKRKHLAYVARLHPSLQRTKFSLYSFVDMTFCLLCPEDSVRNRSLLHRNDDDGMYIFIFKANPYTRALEWIWYLWRCLGGRLPPSLKVGVPGIDATIEVDVPPDLAVDSSRMMRYFSRENILALCARSLRSVSEWREIMQRELDAGRTLELAWRLGTSLYWVEKEDEGAEDSEEEDRPWNREWAVLCGIALKQGGKLPRLEIYLKKHQPSSVHIGPGERLDEPPSIEGYLDRVKPNRVRQPVYLSTHDGNLFLITANKSHPPPPPGLQLAAVSGANDVSAYLKQAEVRRGEEQILSALGVFDFREILVVRRAFQPIVSNEHTEDPSSLQGRGESDRVEWTESDAEDDGGEAGLLKTTDHIRTKTMRSFELLLTSGRVIRFEAHSRRVAVEWIQRLRDLIIYWKHRHRVDAREEMELAHVSSMRPWLTPPRPVCAVDEEHPPETPPDASTSLPALGTFYNWCLMDECKAIVKGGKIFARKGYYGQYQAVHLFLVAGSLVQYRIKPRSTLHPRRHKIVHLLDAYVCSGYLAAQTLPRGQYDPSAPSLPPRRYGDGLQVEESDENMIFMIWYRRHASSAATNKPSDSNNATTREAGVSIPSLGAKRKVAVFRTRSKLERDAWVWAINCEIDKMAKRNHSRQALLRKTEGLIVTENVNSS